MILSEYKGKFQHRFQVKMSWMYLSKFISKDKSGGYSVYFNSRIVLIEHTLRVLTLVWSMNMDHLHNIFVHYFK